MTHQPNLIANFSDADDLACEDLAQVDLAFADADPASTLERSMRWLRYISHCGQDQFSKIVLERAEWLSQSYHLDWPAAQRGGDVTDRHVTAVPRSLWNSRFNAAFNGKQCGTSKFI